MSTAQESSAANLAVHVTGARREAARIEALHQENLKTEIAAIDHARRSTLARELGEKELARAWESEVKAEKAWSVAYERERTEELARRAKVLPAMAGAKGGAS